MSTPAPTLARDARRTAVLVTGVAGVAVAVLASVLVPWSPVPGGTPAAVSAREVFSPAEIARAEAYAHATRWLVMASLGVSLLVSLLLGLTAVGRRLVGRLRGPWWLRVVLGTALVLLVGRLATLPFAFANRRLRLENGLTRQSVGGFLRDVAVGWAVSVVVTAVVVLVLVGAARAWPRRWPAVAGGVLGLLTLGASYVYPVLVEPLFNEFEPLPSGALRAEILALADREGVVVEDVLVADASRRTTTLNAYVSGIGNTRRIVVYDTLVESLPQDQAVSVVAHELAHARHRDVLVGSLLGALMAAAGVGLLGVLHGWCWRPGWPHLREPEVVPLLLALSAVAALALSPVQSAVSRRVETRADVDALLATGDGAAMEAMQRQLALRSLADPTPPGWSYVWFGTHPKVLERIALARDAPS